MWMEITRVWEMGYAKGCVGCDVRSDVCGVALTLLHGGRTAGLRCPRQMAVCHTNLLNYAYGSLAYYEPPYPATPLPFLDGPVL